MAWHLNVVGSAAEIQTALDALVVTDTLEAQQFELVKQAILSQVGLPPTPPSEVDVGVLFAQSTLHLTAHGSASNISSRSNFTLQVVNATNRVNIIGNPGESESGTINVVPASGGDGDGLIFGPNPETANEIDAAGDAFFNIFDGSNYTTLSFGNPVTVTDFIEITGSTVLTSVEFRNLVSVGDDLNIESSELVSALFPLLETVGAEFTLSVNPLLETLDISSLVTVGGQMNITGSSLTEILAPALVTMVDVSITGNTLLTNFSAPLWVPSDGNSIDFSGNALPAAVINEILAKCVAAGLTTAFIALNGGTNAAPTGQGIADKATLIGNGCTVTTN